MSLTGLSKNNIEIVEDFKKASYKWNHIIKIDHGYTCYKIIVPKKYICIYNKDYLRSTGTISESLIIIIDIERKIIHLIDTKSKVLILEILAACQRVFEYLKLPVKIIPPLTEVTRKNCDYISFFLQYKGVNFKWCAGTSILLDNNWKLLITLDKFSLSNSSVLEYIDYKIIK